MPTLTCVACRKIIDAEPPRCPACGAAQGGPGRGARRRAVERVGAAALALALGIYAGRKAYTPPSSLRYVRRAALRFDDNVTAGKVKALMARLKADPGRPYAELEDVLVQPGSYVGKPGSFIAMLFSFHVRENRAIAMMGWGSGASIDVDVSALTDAEKKAMMHGCAGPNWAAFRGSWKAGSMGVQDVRSEGVHLYADSFESVGYCGVTSFDQLMSLKTP